MTDIIRLTAAETAARIASGELTAVVAMTATGLILYFGFLSRPGEPSGEISLQYGWFVSLLGAVAMLFGGALRASGTERPRKPPGVL